MSSNLNLSWHAIYVKNRSEKKVAETLTKKGVENYCPYNIKQQPDKKKTVTEPLFGALVFVRIQPEQATMIKSLSGVVNFAYWLGKPVVIKDEEINAIKQLVQTKESLKVEKTAVNFLATVKLSHERKISKDGKLVQISHIPFKAELPSLGYTVITASMYQKEVAAAAEQNTHLLTVEEAVESSFWQKLSKEVG